MKTKGRFWGNGANIQKVIKTGDLALRASGSGEFALGDHGWTKRLGGVAQFSHQQLHWRIITRA
jgi:hypothetical protein